jgi:hypothetical protein
MKMAKATLENRVDRLLASPAVVAPLKSRGVTIKEIAASRRRSMVESRLENLLERA